MVMATKTRGQEEIAKLVDGAVQLIPIDEPEKLGSALNHLAKSPDIIKNGRFRARSGAEGRLCWEKESQQLVGIFERSL